MILASMAIIHVGILGDIVGSSGRKAVANWLPQMRKEYDLELVIANGENAAHGFGLTPVIATELFAMGVDVLTGGNHSWDKKDIVKAFDQYPGRIIRPANYPVGNPGQGSSVVAGKSGHKIGVINVMGRIFMDPLNCPFEAFEREFEKIRQQATIVFLDIHAEASSEKQAMGYYVDGRVAGVVGTHTHVQTADNRVLPRGTGYLTDLGMNGPWDSVIGMQKEIIIDRFTKKLPIRMEVADGPGVFQGAIFSVDTHSGLCKSVERIQKYPTYV